MEFQTMLQNHRERNFDAVFTNWVLDNFQIASAPSALFHSREAETRAVGEPERCPDPELDAAIERAAHSRRTRRAAGRVARVHGVLQREQPVTFMFWLNELAGVRAELAAWKWTRAASCGQHRSGALSR
jgi:peptide/nickel transport system substrate-binding protein